jgi:hypothetical protein
MSILRPMYLQLGVLALIAAPVSGQAPAPSKSEPDSACKIVDNLRQGKGSSFTMLEYNQEDQAANFNECEVVTKGSTRTVKSKRLNEVEDGESARIPHRRSLFVLVSKTNTALYDIELGNEKVETPEIAILNQFLTGLGPYFTELSVAIAGPPAAPVKGDELRERGEAVLQALNRLDQLLYASTLTSSADVKSGISLTSLQMQLLRALELMRTPDSIAPARAALRGDLTRAQALQPALTERDEGSDRRLSLVGDLLVAYPILSERRQLLQASLAKEQAKDPANRAPTPELDRAGKILDQGTKALTESDKVMSAAYAMERMTLLTVDAASVVLVDSVKITADTGRKLTLTLSPRKADMVARLVGDEESLTVTALPRWHVRPAVGLAFLVAPDARYSRFGTTEVGDSVAIVASDEQDSRFTWGLTLSATFPFLTRGRMAFWPEITINPSSDLKAFAVGGAFSYSSFKVGAGMLFTKHSDLVGQELDQHLPSADDLRTRETYGDPKLYLSVSVFSRPPFVQSKD